MKLLLLNPNTSQEITELLYKTALTAAAPDVEIDALTAPRGVPYISTRTEEAIAAVSTLEILAEYAADYDGAIIAAFGDPGLVASKELFDFPVTGLAEASMLAACMLGRRFGIVTFAHDLGDWYADSVRRDWMEDRCVGIRTLNEPFQAIANVQQEKEAKLIELIMTSIEQDKADAVILAGAPLSGLASQISNSVPVPLIDCCMAAVVQLTATVRLSTRKATVGSSCRPAPKSSTGLTPKLADRIAGKT